MSLISSFKSRRYRREDEWRIVCSPIYSPNLDQDIDDNNFGRLIKSEDSQGKAAKRHIELTQIQQPVGMIIACPDREIPFTRTYYRPGASKKDEILDALRKAGCSDIGFLQHPRVRRWWQFGTRP
jgi:hypothetical protein